MASEKSDGEREPKKLRSSEPDLKVILGSGDTETIQWHHSQKLASKSNYIDTMLSTPMKEKDDHVISFPDITPDTWNQMMKFLDSPVAARKMKARDALDVALFYDKYEFVEGETLCEEVMVDYFKSTKAAEKNYTLDLDLIIDLVIVAHKANLEVAFEAGITYIWPKLKSHVKPFGRTMFTEENLKRLAPILEYSIDNIERIGLGSLSTYTQGFPTDYGLGQQDFPKRFVSSCQQREESAFLDRCISHVEVSGSKCSADGSYEKDVGCWDMYFPPSDEAEERTCQWGRRSVDFRLQYWKDDAFEGWAIVRRYPRTRYDDDGEPIEEPVFKESCWIAPYSKNCKRPPVKGWISSDIRARGNPTIKYILRESIG